MSSNNSPRWTPGTPEAIFAPVLDPSTIRYARGPRTSRPSSDAARPDEAPWLFGELRSPIIPASWLDGSEWHATGKNTSKQREQFRLSQSDLAQPGAVLTKHPRVDLTALAEQAIVARAGLGSWRETHLAEAYEPVLERAASLSLNEVPLFTSTFQRLLGHGCAADGPLIDVLHKRRSDLFTERADAVALIDLEMLVGHWLPNWQMDQHWQQMRQASRLREVARSLAERLLVAESRSTLSAPEVVRRRGWGQPKATLEQLGEERGVTRERVRQLFVPIERRLGERRWPISPRFEAGLRQLIAPSDLDDEDHDLLEELGIDWSIPAVVDLLKALGRDEIAARVKEASAVRERGLPEQLRATVRRHRSLLGFLDLPLLAADPVVQASGRDPVRLVKKVYSRVVVGTDFALATSDPSSTAERVAAQQFFITPTIGAAEFREGFVRVAKKKQQPSPPPMDQLMELLTAVGAATWSGSMVTGPPGELAEGTLHRWLADRLNEADGQVLHVESLVRLAIRDQKNISSITNYVTYEPFVRRIGGTGLVRLVGRTVPGDAQDIATRIADAQRKPTTIVAAPHQSGLVIDLTAGTALFTSGVLAVPAELRAVWPKPGPTPRCMCEHAFESRLTVNRGVITGWQSLLAHLTLNHGLLEGGRVRMVVDGRNLLIEEIAAP